MSTAVVLEQIRTQLLAEAENSLAAADRYRSPNVRASGTPPLSTPIAGSQQSRP